MPPGVKAACRVWHNDTANACEFTSENVHVEYG